ncbi:MAG: NADH-quinone oxidoreductase subunit C [Candidatus Bathyarchaeia archaeon]
MSEKAFIDALKTQYGDYIESIEIHNPKRVSILVDREVFLDIAETLKDELEFTHPISAGVIDYPEEELMQMNYYLEDPETRVMLIFMVNIPRDDLVIPSLTQVWEAMSFHEREANEMFGVEFEGHPNLIPLLLPPDWKGGYPLRKDFKGEGVEE